jgi:putative DeoR family transcriptional regulator (stage III sporulation protein D)
MKRNERAVEIAQYMIANRCTVRAAAKLFKVCKSTVFRDMTVELPKISYVLYGSVRKVLDSNKKERCYRGGNATKAKYAKV